MLLETKKEEEEDRIKCGKCSSEFFPQEDEEGKSVCVCPMCGFGKFQENAQPTSKKILFD